MAIGRQMKVSRRLCADNDDTVILLVAYLF